MKKVSLKSLASGLILLAFFSVLTFGIYDAISKEKHELALGVVSVVFVFSYLMLKIPSITKFFVGGKHLNISVNEEKNCEIQKRVDDEEPKSLS